MALTPSGTISLADINTALNRSATAPISMNDSAVRFLANQTSGSVNMDAMRNKYTFSGTITVGVYDDGKSYILGYAGPGFGSVNPSTLNGGTVLEMGYDGNIGSSMYIAWGGVNTSLPGTFNMRYTVNGTSGVLVQYYSNRNQWWSGNGVLTPTYFTTGMVGGTYSWQFSQ